MIEVGTLVLMGAFALLVIHGKLLRLSVIYLAVFSLLGSFLYVLYSAPELAIAEAVIGSGLVTLLYLAALKRNRVYTIAVVRGPDAGRLTDAEMVRVERSAALREAREFFVRREFEVQVIFASDPLASALRSPAYDLVMTEDDEGFAIYTDEESYVMLELELLFQMHGARSACRFVRYSPEAVL